ncbi:MAG: hypothetical protein LBK12_05010 [Odoribacteraceae bacterium]|nr:hypothetical protein [Odoribacteraceae bacterium]
MKNMNRIIIALLVACATLSCGKDEQSAFRGEDNYIASFALTRGETRYPAAVSADSILLSVLDNASLEGVVPAVVASENAVISPDPASITDWESPATFTVTAFDGRQRTYAYRLTRRPLSLEGDATLTTQAEVDAFAAAGISIVNGNLSIAPAADVDAIQSLAGLSKLKSVKYALTIGAAYGGSNIDGLENLESAGNITVGSSYSTKMPLLTSVTFPALQVVKGDLTLYATAAKTVDFPALQLTKGNFSVNGDSLYTCNVPELTAVGGEFRVWYSRNISTSLVVPKLQTAGSLSFSSLTKLAGLEFPELREVAGRVYITSASDVVSMPALQSAGSLQVSATARQGADFRSLTRVNGDADLNVQGRINCSSLTTVTGRLMMPTTEDYTAYGSLSSTGTLYLNIGENCESLAGLEKLTRVEGDLNIAGSYSSVVKLSDLSGLRALAFVGGKMSIEYLPNVTSLSALQSLASIGSAGMAIRSVGLANFSSSTLPPSLAIVGTLSMVNMPLLEVIDVRGLGLKSITLNAMPKAIQLINNESALDLLYLEACKQVDCAGMGELKNLNMFVNGSAGIDFVISGIKKVGAANLNHGGASVTLPDLEEVSGTLALPNLAILPRLTRVGELTASANAWKGSLPLLAAIDGNCTLSTGYAASSWESLPLPALVSIGGTLSIKGYSSNAAYRNTKLTSLDDLASLASVKAVDIRYNSALVDYSGLRNALASFAAGDWTTADNAYNPSYQDLVDGNFTKQP